MHLYDKSLSKLILLPAIVITAFLLFSGGVNGQSTSGTYTNDKVLSLESSPLVPSSDANGAVYTRYEQGHTLSEGTYSLDANVRTYNLEGRNVRIFLACGNAAGCGGLAMNEIVSGSTVEFTSEYNDYSTKSKQFTLPSGTYLYNYRVTVNDGSSADIAWVSLKKATTSQGISWGDELLTNNDFNSVTSTVTKTNNPSSWSAGTPDAGKSYGWGLQFANVTPSYTAGSVTRTNLLYIKSSERVHKAANGSSVITRFEQNHHLEPGDYYIHTVYAAPQLQGRGAEINIACGMSSCQKASGTAGLQENMGALQLNQKGTSFTEAHNNVAGQRITIRQAGTYSLRLFVNDGSEVMVDFINLWKFNGDSGDSLINGNGNISFDSYTETDVTKDQPNNWGGGTGNWGYQFGAVRTHADCGLTYNNCGGTDDDDDDDDTIPSGQYYKDVKGTTFEYYINRLRELDVTHGYSDRTYRPSTLVPRDQMAKFVVRAFNFNINTGGNRFPDVPSNHPFFNYIQTLKNLDIVEGYGDGYYHPEAQVSRGQITKFITLSLDAKGVDVNYDLEEDFTDVSNNNEFRDYIAYLANQRVAYENPYTGQDTAERIIIGYTNGTFEPDTPVTRGQLSKITYLSMVLMGVDEVDDDLPPDPCDCPENYVCPDRVACE